MSDKQKEDSENPVSNPTAPTAPSNYPVQIPALIQIPDCNYLI